MLTIFDQLLLAFLAGVLGALVVDFIYLNLMFRETRRSIANARDDMMVDLRDSMRLTVAIEVMDQLAKRELKASLREKGGTTPSNHGQVGSAGSVYVPDGTVVAMIGGGGGGGNHGASTVVPLRSTDKWDVEMWHRTPEPGPESEKPLENKVITGYCGPGRVHDLSSLFRPAGPECEPPASSPSDSGSGSPSTPSE